MCECPSKKRDSEAMSGVPTKILGGDPLSVQTSAIVLATSNPAQADEEGGIIPRFNKTGLAEPTETYHIKSIETSSALWPQAQLQYPLITAAGVTTATNIPSLIPINTFVNALRPDLCCRLIRSFKNGLSTGTGLKSYWFYDCVTSEGDRKIRVPCADGTQLQTSAWDLDVAGYKLGCTRLSQCMTADFAAGAGGGVFFATGGAAGATGSIIANWQSNTANPHSMTVGSAQSKVCGFYSKKYANTYVYASTAANAAAAVYDYQQGNVIAPNPASPSAAQLGGLLTGCFIFYWITPPNINPASATYNWEIQIYGYNEQQEYPVTSLSGTVVQGAPPAGTAQANRTFAAFRVQTDDYYRFRFSLSPNALGVSLFSEEVEIGIMYIGTGETFSHIATPDLELVDREIVGARHIASSCLLKNGTPDQYLGGFQIGVQGIKSKQWQQYIDNGNPFATLSQQGVGGGQAVVPLKFKQGGYFWLRPTEVEDYEMEECIISPSSNTGGQVPTNNDTTWIAQLDEVNTAFHVVENTAINTATAPGQPVPIANVMFTYDFTGEFMTNSRWRHPVMTMYMKEAWVQAIDVLKTVPQFTENDTHDFLTLMGALGGLGKDAAGFLARKFPQLAPAIGNVIKWAPKILRAGATVAPLLL